MPRKILSIQEIAEIEQRLQQGAISDQDVQQLLDTARQLLGDAPRSETAKRTGKSVADKPPAVKVIGQAGAVAEIFTDGACAGNPGPGGWGALIRIGGQEQELSGGEPRTTNNRMELTAAIEALKRLPDSCRATLTTDSQYLRKGITQWIKNWKVNGWKNASKQPVKNAELWRELDALNRRHSIDWQWVRGHIGHPENERCDELARRAIGRLR